MGKNKNKKNNKEKEEDAIHEDLETVIAEEVSDEYPEEEKIVEENLETEDIDNNDSDEVEIYKTQLARLQADFLNYKKRAEKEKEGTFAFAIESFTLDLLPILDNFERALNSNENKEDTFFQGVEYIYDDINKLLERNNIEKFESVGEDFDPNKHHAVVMEESDEYDANKVIEVLQPGYKMNEKIIRPAMVKVSK